MVLMVHGAVPQNAFSRVLDAVFDVGPIRGHDKYSLASLALVDGPGCASGESKDAAETYLNGNGRWTGQQRICGSEVHVAGGTMKRRPLAIAKQGEAAAVANAVESVLPIKENWNVRGCWRRRW